MLVAPLLALALGAASPADGIYFPTQGTYLLIREGDVFLGGPPGKEPWLAGRLEGERLVLFGQPEAPIQAAVVEGHLWVSAPSVAWLRPLLLPYGLGQGVLDVEGKAPPSRTDLGQVGLLPVLAPDLLGRWVTRKAPLEGVEVVAPTGTNWDFDQVSFLDMPPLPDPWKVHFRPDALGVLHVEVGRNCGMNHGDMPVSLFWFALPGRVLARYHQPSRFGHWLIQAPTGLTLFRRAEPWEPFDPDSPPHHDPAPPEHAERRDRW